MRSQNPLNARSILWKFLDNSVNGVFNLLCGIMSRELAGFTYGVLRSHSFVLRVKKIVVV